MKSEKNIWLPNFKITFKDRVLFKVDDNSIYNLLATLLVVFIILFPKGGIKVANIPLTVGYGLLFFIAGLCFSLYTYNGKIRFVSKDGFLCLAAMLPFFVLSSLKILGAGFNSLGFLISFYTSLFFIPFAFLLLFYHPLQRLDFDIFKNMIRSFVFVTAFYGIFLFFYKIYTGSFIQIPLLTINLGDMGQLEKKHIDRGGIFKLISTYNNGNVYGVCMMMLLPFYCFIENRRYRKLVVKIALLLTLSRTVWIGLILNEAFFFIFLQKKSVKSIFGIAIAFVFIILGLFAGLSYIGEDILFLFDSNLGGRLEQVHGLMNADFFPPFNRKFEVIEEMVYFSVAEIFGWLGMFLFILYLISPMLVFFFARKRKLSKERIAIVLGLLLYMIVAFVDGAILNIPTMAIYWFMATLLLTDFSLYQQKFITKKETSAQAN